MAVGIVEVDGNGIHPLVIYQFRNRDALLFQDGRGPFDIRFAYAKREVLRGPFPFVFLQYNHTGIAAGMQEEPVSAIVAHAFLQPKHVLVKGFGSRQVFHADRDFIEAFDR